MTEQQRLAAGTGSRPPVVVMLCSAGTALVGLVVSMLWLVVLTRSLSLVILGPWLTVHLDEVVRAIGGGSYVILVAGTSLLAAVDYWRRRRRGIYLHILAILLLVDVVSLAWAGVAFLVVSLAILATMGAYLKARPAPIITVVALALTCASSLYQQMGPQMGKYGTECIPIEDCFGPLLGAGYPVQYIVNFPGITDPTSLGVEDDFRLGAFALDALFYFAITFPTYTLIRYSRARRKSAASEG